MKTPVIIAAYNEAEHIGRTLRSLNATDVNPIVVVNGDEGALETSQEALRYTPNVYTSPEQGKLPAIQSALRMLYAQDTSVMNQPALLLDADSRPLFPNRWHREMTESVRGDEAHISVGAFAYDQKNPAVFIYRALRSQQFAKRARDEGTLLAAVGRNMAVNFAGDAELFEKVLEMPHTWPGEDSYLAHVIGGEDLQGYTQLIGVGHAVLTSSRYTLPVGYRFIHGDDAYGKLVKQGYARRRATGATHYFDAHERMAIRYQEDSDSAQ